MTSLPGRVKGTIRTLYESRLVRRIFLLLIVVLAIIGGRLISIFGEPQPEIAILILITVILIYLEVLETGLLRIDDYLSRPSVLSNRTKTDEDDGLMDRIARRITEFHPRKVHLLDLSGKNAEHILKTTLTNDIETYLLIKIPQSANTSTQYNQIVTFLTETLPTLRQGKGTSHLHIRLYWQDSAVRGRLIGNRYLFLSWYIRIFNPPSSENEQSDLVEKVPSSDEVFDAIRSGQNREKQKLWGDDVVHVEFSRENEGYEELSEDFFKNRLYKNLWASAITPKQLYEHEQAINEDEPVYDGDSLNEESDGVVRPFRFGKPLAEWVDEASIDEEEQTERVEFLEAISDSTTDPESLFERSLLPKL